jgi:predicted NAD/FAD-dependent oxidoreductase
VKRARPVAIIGAGLSGIGCARALRAAGVDARLFERAPQAGGRCASRLWQGHLVDYGVQYFSVASALFRKELVERLRQIRPIIQPILDPDDKLVPSPKGLRYYALQGNHFLAHALSSGLDLRCQTPVTGIDFTAEGVQCLGETYAAVVSSLPGPQTAALFQLSRPAAAYDAGMTALLEYAGAGLGREVYGRLGRPGSLIGDSYCESLKSGRTVGEKTVFVVHATAEASRDLAAMPPERALVLLAREHRELWKLADVPCSARFLHRWDYAWPRVDERHRPELPPGAFICGDSVSGATLEEAWLNGGAVADEVLAYLAALGA